jgi:hypothetical protein
LFYFQDAEETLPVSKRPHDFVPDEEDVENQLIEIDNRLISLDGSIENISGKNYVQPRSSHWVR